MKLQSKEFKERLSNEGDITLVRKFEKRSNLSHGEKPINCTLTHCRCKNSAENFWSPCDTDAVPNFFSTRPLSGFPCVECLGISNCMCGISAGLMLAKFRVRERKYLSVRFVLRSSEVRFFWLVKSRLTSVQLKTLNSLLCFSQVQNCW